MSFFGQIGSAFGNVGTFIKNLVTGHSTAPQAAALTAETKQLIVQFENAFDAAKGPLENLLNLGNALAAAYPPAAAPVAAIAIGVHSIEAAESGAEAFFGVPDADDAPAATPSK